LGDKKYLIVHACVVIEGLGQCIGGRENEERRREREGKTRARGMR
jgi:hypothetical protein